MSNVNRVILLGHLGADPESRALANGKTLVRFSLATNNRKTQDTEWHQVTAFGTLAEQCATYLRKGRMCFVEGRLSYRSQKDEDTGKANRFTSVVAQQVRFLGSANHTSSQPSPSTDVEVVDPAAILLEDPTPQSPPKQAISRRSGAPKRATA